MALKPQSEKTEVGLDEMCRLCLTTEASTMYEIGSNRLYFKIVFCLGLDCGDPDNSLESPMPNKICVSCRNNLERFYTFKVESAKHDRELREWLQEDGDVARLEESQDFIRTVRHDVEEFDGDEPPSKRRLVDDSTEEYVSIEKTVRTALSKQGYFGDFEMQVEKTEKADMRLVKVNKDNGAMLVMRVKMPERKAGSSGGGLSATQLVEFKRITGKLDTIISKCTRIDTRQADINQTVAKTEGIIENVLRTVKNISSAAAGDASVVVQDAFDFPITTIDDLHELEQRLKRDSDFRANLLENFGKYEADAPKKMSYNILRKLVHTDLLSCLTWSGYIKDTGSSTYMKDEGPMVMRNYEKFLETLLDIVRTRFPDFSHVEMAEGLKNLMSKLRYKRRHNTAETMIEEESYDMEPDMH